MIKLLKRFEDSVVPNNALKTLLLSLLLCSLGMSQTPPKSGAAKTIFATKAFDIDVHSLSPRFLGHNPFEVYDALFPLTVEVGLGCSQFEKTDACQERMNRIYERKFWRNLTPESMFAFSVEADCRYSADEETIRCPTPVTIAQRHLTLSNKLVSSTSYVGENSFGVKRRVLLKRFENLHIADNDGVPDLRVKDISPEAARRVLFDLRILWIGSFVSPFTKRERAEFTPTFDEPVHIIGDNKTLVFEIEQVWLYHFPTGKIYARG